MQTLLVIDDSDSVRQVIRDGLGGDFRVLEAQNGLEGLKVLERERVDVVVLDAVMPVMDGAATLRVVRARGHRMPVILLTSETKTSRIGTLLALGAQELIVKPMRIEELRRKVGELTPTKPADVIPADDASSAARRAAARLPVLLVDGNEGAVARFWAAAPSFADLESCTDLTAALAAGARSQYRAVILDAAALQKAPGDLVGQLRRSQPGAHLVGVFLRTTPDRAAAARELGLDAGLYKPYVAEDVTHLLEGVAGLPRTIDADGGRFTPHPLPAAVEAHGAFASRLKEELLAAVEQAAEASLARVWLDIAHPMPHPLLAPVVGAVYGRCTELGLELGIIDAAGVVAAMGRALVDEPLRIVDSADLAD